MEDSILRVSESLKEYKLSHDHISNDGFTRLRRIEDVTSVSGSNITDLRDAVKNLVEAQQNTAISVATLATTMGVLSTSFNRLLDTNKISNSQG